MATDRQTDHATCIATGRILRYALRCVLKITANAKIGGIGSGNNINGTKLVVNASSSIGRRMRMNSATTAINWL